MAFKYKIATFMTIRLKDYSVEWGRARMAVRVIQSSLKPPKGLGNSIHKVL